MTDSFPVESLRMNSEQLFSFVRVGDTIKVQDLLKKDIKIIHTKDARKQTPLHMAVKYSNLNIVQLLLDHGAGPNVSDKDGKTPLLLAAGYPSNDCSILHTLFAHGAYSHYNDNNGNTILHYAVCSKSMTKSRMLIEKGLFTDKKNKDGKTPLFIACETNQDSLVSLLLEHGANINIKNIHTGDSMLHVAAENGFINIVELLMDDVRCHINDENNKNETALDKAVSVYKSITSHDEFISSGDSRVSTGNEYSQRTCGSATSNNIELLKLIDYMRKGACDCHQQEMKDQLKTIPILYIFDDGIYIEETEPNILREL